LLLDGEYVDPVSLIDPGFIDVARVTGGGSFGALALLDGKPRMATIKCLTRCHFMVLTRSDYEKTLSAIDSKRRGLKVSFVKKIPIFSKLTRTFLTKLSYSLKPLHVTKDHYLYREGDPADKVFIVKEGEFVVTKNLVSSSKQSENIQEILENP
jgi:CRP-like cAMP-binding protein